jgi:hypothetical protein
MFSGIWDDPYDIYLCAESFDKQKDVYKAYVYFGLKGSQNAPTDLFPNQATVWEVVFTGTNVNVGPLQLTSDPFPGALQKLITSYKSDLVNVNTYNAACNPIADIDNNVVALLQEQQRKLIVPALSSEGVLTGTGQLMWVSDMDVSEIDRVIRRTSLVQLGSRGLERRLQLLLKIAETKIGILDDKGVFNFITKYFRTNDLFLAIINEAVTPNPPPTNAETCATAKAAVKFSALDSGYYNPSWLSSVVNYVTGSNERMQCRFTASIGKSTTEVTLLSNDLKNMDSALSEMAKVDGVVYEPINYMALRLSSACNELEYKVYTAWLATLPEQYTSAPFFKAWVDALSTRSAFAPVPVGNPSVLMACSPYVYSGFFCGSKSDGHKISCKFIQVPSTVLKRVDILDHVSDAVAKSVQKYFQDSIVTKEASEEVYYAWAKGLHEQFQKSADTWDYSTLPDCARSPKS